MTNDARAESEPQGPNTEQSRHWNGAGGATWVTFDARVVGQIRPFGLHALERVAVAPGMRVLDVGCGSGETTRELARRVGPTGSVTGLDISAPLLELARSVARDAGIDNVTFELADAQIAELPERAFDRLFSRFGVMFFDDPPAAFANLRRALRPGAGVAFVCWRGPEHNPWLTVPLLAAAQHVPFTPPAPGAPGPLAFADPARVRAILGGAGFAEIAIEAIDEIVSVGGPGGLDEITEFAMNFGPTATLARGAEPAVRAAIAVSVRAALAPYHGPEGVCLKGGAWLVTATSP